MEENEKNLISELGNIEFKELIVTYLGADMREWMKCHHPEMEEDRIEVLDNIIIKSCFTMYDTLKMMIETDGNELVSSTHLVSMMCKFGMMDVIKAEKKNGIDWLPEWFEECIEGAISGVSAILLTGVTKKDILEWMITSWKGKCDRVVSFDKIINYSYLINNFSKGSTSDNKEHKDWVTEAPSSIRETVSILEDGIVKILREHRVDDMAEFISRNSSKQICGRIIVGAMGVYKKYEEDKERLLSSSKKIETLFKFWIYTISASDIRDAITNENELKFAQYLFEIGIIGLMKARDKKTDEVFDIIFDIVKQHLNNNK